ncbi:MAG: hypothetical protein LBC52_08095 [Treponema sp.]|jgi:hypothetical protein|nr:hypothetical protein [Treponema sp.]
MKYFICALGHSPGRINLGIPAEQTERIVSITRIQDAICETENQEIFISLPALLRQKDTTSPHGIVLKQRAGQAPDKKITLLTPKIDAELEIPEEGIRDLPRAMHGVYKHFRGAYCTDTNIILILNPEKIMEGKS